MFNPRDLIAASFLAVVAANALYGQAQPNVNRRADALAILPVPGAPGGPDLWEVHLAWSSIVDDAPGSLDLSTTATIFSGAATPFSQSQSIFYDPPSGGFNGCSDTCGGGCGSSGLLIPWFCYMEIDPPFTFTCHCKPLRWMPSSTPEPISPGQTVAGTVAPAAGAEPDTDPSDDSLSFVFDGEPVYWARRLESVSHTPTAGAPDSFFDIDVEWKVGGRMNTSSLPTAPDLSTEMVLLDAVGNELASVIHPVFLSITECGAPGDCNDSTSCGLVIHQDGLIEQSTCEPFFPELFPDACACVSTLTTTIPGVQIPDLDGGLFVILRPAPGALPELPGFPDDDELPLCPTDLDADGQTGVTDFLALLALWGTDPGGPPDFDGNGTVDVLDFLELLAQWGPCFPV